MTNHLYYGDNLKALRERTTSYNVLFRGPKGHDSAAQMLAAIRGAWARTT